MRPWPTSNFIQTSSIKCPPHACTWSSWSRQLRQNFTLSLKNTGPFKTYAGQTRYKHQQQCCQIDICPILRTQPCRQNLSGMQPSIHTQVEQLLPRLQQLDKGGKPERECRGPCHITHKIYTANIQETTVRKECNRFCNKQNTVHSKLEFPITGHFKPVTALHHLKIWPINVTTIHKFKGKVMPIPMSPEVPSKINTNLDTLDNALNVNDVIIIFSQYQQFALGTKVSSSPESKVTRRGQHMDITT